MFKIAIKKKKERKKKNNLLLLRVLIIRIVKLFNIVRAFRKITFF